jgi:HK97 family phage major capsid protein
MPEATQTSLEDIGFNVEAWLIEEIASNFAEEEGESFISGDGVKKPPGVSELSNLHLL